MTLKPILLVALLAAVALAGCGGKDKDAPVLPVVDEPSAKQFALKPAEEVWFTASDGVRINNAVYRPDTTEPVPVFINFSPYWGDTAMTDGDAFSTYIIHEYVERGYAVVLSAVRGTGHSEGCFQVGGDRELQDASEVVDFFGTQDWSNGNVAAGGKSYDSTTQNGMIAKFPPEHLRGLFHVSGITDMYRYTMHDGVAYGNGARTIEFTPSYAVGQGLNEYGFPLASGGATTNDEDADSLLRLIDDVACPELAGHVADPTTAAVAGLKTPYWQERDYTAFIGDSSWSGSIFFVHGLQDWNVQPDHIQPWIDNVLQKGDIQVVGWLHQWQQDGTGHVYPMRDDWNKTMLAWLDQTLKGRDTGLAPHFESMATDGLFRASASWPPVAAQTFDLSGAEVTCNATCATQEITVATAGSAGLRMAGAPVLHVTFQAQNPDPTLSAVLYREAGGERTWVGEGMLRGILRDSLSTPSPIVPSMTYTADIMFYPLDTVLAAGESWVLELGGVPIQGASPLSALLPPDLYPGDVFYDVAAGTTLTVPVLPPANGLLDPQPTAMACFTC